MTVAIERPVMGCSARTSRHSTSGPSRPQAAAVMRRSSAKAKPRVWEVSSGTQ
jgi:hypothetical protein